MKCSTRLVLSRVLMRISESRLCGRPDTFVLGTTKHWDEETSRSKVIGGWGWDRGASSGAACCYVRLVRGSGGLRGRLRISMTSSCRSLSTRATLTRNKLTGSESSSRGATLGVRSALPMPGTKNITTITSFSEQELHPTKAEESQEDKWRSSGGGNTA